VTLTGINEKQLFQFFNDMRNGSITKKDGQPYRAVADYVKCFKAFWHWHMKVSKKESVNIADITEDLDSSRTKPRWVYLTEEDVKTLCHNANPQYRVLIMFMYDAGIRSPTELINVKVSDLYGNYKKLHIREETVKKGSFGRKINLMLCGDLLKQHIADKELQANDQLFKISPACVNRYLKRLAKKVLGEGTSPAGEKYSNLTMYDFRHCSCCYWLPRYKSESALKYRFGWRKSDKIHYYSELLGMKDTITEEDLLMDMTKTEIERRLLKTEQENEILKEKIESYDNEVRQVKTLLKIFASKFQQLEKMGLLINSQKQLIDL
jgi:integrase